MGSPEQEFKKGVTRQKIRSFRWYWKLLQYYYPWHHSLFTDPMPSIPEQIPCHYKAVGQLALWCDKGKYFAANCSHCVI